jgi:hypothetical protein
LNLDMFFVDLKLVELSIQPLILFKEK